MTEPRPASSEIRISRSLPTSRGSMCSKVRASASTRGSVQPALVGEGVPADVGLRRGPARGCRSRRRGARSRSACRSRSGGDAVVAELELQRGQDRDQVRVAGPLAVAVDRPLHERRPGADGGDRVGDPALGVVVGVDADRDRLARERGDDIGGGLLDLVRKAGAVRVAEADVLGPGRDRGLEAREGVAADRRARRRRSARGRRRRACRPRRSTRPSRRSSPGSRRGRPS